MKDVEPQVLLEENRDRRSLGSVSFIPVSIVFLSYIVYFLH